MREIRGAESLGPGNLSKRILFSAANNARAALWRIYRCIRGHVVHSSCHPSDDLEDGSRPGPCYLFFLLSAKHNITVICAARMYLWTGTHVHFTSG